jgi:hypothetical protein
MLKNDDFWEKVFSQVFIQKLKLKALWTALDFRIGIDIPYTYLLFWCLLF